MTFLKTATFFNLAAALALLVPAVSKAAVIEGPKPREDILRNRVEPAKAVQGMRIIFEVEGLDLLDDVWANRKNPEPPRFCGQPFEEGGKWNIWVNDSDRDYGRQAETVGFQFLDAGRDLTEGQPVVKVPGPVPPKGCDKGRLFQAPAGKPVLGVHTADAAGHAGVLPMTGVWPPNSGTRLLDDDASPDAEVFADYDITTIDASMDQDWLYLSMQVRGAVSQGTTSPMMEAHLYGIALLDTSLGDRVQNNSVTGFMAHYMAHYKIANQKEAVLMRLRNDKVKLPDDDIAAIARANVVHFKIRKKAIGFKPGKPIKVIGFTAEVPRLGPVTQVKVKDVTSTGQIQAF